MGSADPLECRFSQHNVWLLGGLDLQQSSPVRWLAGLHGSTSRTHVMLHSTSALLRLQIQSRPQVAQSVPFSHSFMPQPCITCWPTVSEGLLVEGRHTHTIHALTAEKLSRACTRMSVFSTHLLSPCSALAFQALVMWGWHMGPFSGLCLQEWNKP